MTSHPPDARYFASRSAARLAAGAGERVIRLGRFADGSFGCHAPRKPNGQTVGGPNAIITVWMTTAQR